MIRAMFCWQRSVQIKGQGKYMQTQTLSRRWKQCKHSLMDEWINKMWYVDTMEYYSAPKRKELLTHAITHALLFHRRACSKKTAIYKPGNGLSPDMESGGTSMLDFSASRTVRNECVCFLFFAFWPHPRHMEVSRPGIESELQLWLTPQLWQHHILNPLCQIGDWTHPSSMTRVAAEATLDP